MKPSKLGTKILHALPLGLPLPDSLMATREGVFQSREGSGWHAPARSSMTPMTQCPPHGNTKASKVSSLKLSDVWQQIHFVCLSVHEPSGQRGATRSPSFDVKEIRYPPGATRRVSRSGLFWRCIPSLAKPGCEQGQRMKPERPYSEKNPGIGENFLSKKPRLHWSSD